MDDRYAIRLAKTNLREAYNKGSVNGVLSVFGDRFVDMSTGRASFYGAEARSVLRHRLRELFALYDVRLAITIVSIRVQGPWAFDRGLHHLTLTPKSGGSSTTTHTRYLEIWQKSADGKWKIAVFFDNDDVPPQMPPKEVLAELRRAHVAGPRPRVRGKQKKTPQAARRG